MVRFIRLLLNEKGRFLWSAHRITERQKAGKARSIKGKQLKNSRSTALKQLVELLSSQKDNSYLEKPQYLSHFSEFEIWKKCLLCVYLRKNLNFKFTKASPFLLGLPFVLPVINTICIIIIYSQYCFKCVLSDFLIYQ